MSENIKILQQMQTVDMDAGEVFSSAPSGRVIKGYDTPNEFTPKLNSNYPFHEHSRDVVVWFIDPSDVTVAPGYCVSDFRTSITHNSSLYNAAITSNYTQELLKIFVRGLSCRLKLFTLFFIAKVGNRVGNVKNLNHKGISIFC